jgi:hypothetical protein
VTIDFDAARRTSASLTAKYIADLQQEIERLKRHNAIYYPEYDPERDEPLDAAWETGNRAAWRAVVDLALTKLVGEEWIEKAGHMERELADMDRELRELWTAVAEDEPFPQDIYRPDVLKQIRRMIEA